MSNIRLFFSKKLSADLTDKLDKPQSHYLTKVMRVKENEVFSLFIFLTTVRSNIIGKNFVTPSSVAFWIIKF